MQWDATARADSRRRFLRAAAWTAGATAFGWANRGLAGGFASEDFDPRVPQIVVRTLGIDTHNHIDVPMEMADMPGPAIDLHGEMQRSGLAAICMTFATDYQAGNAYRRFNNAMTGMDRALAQNRMQRALTAADVRTAHAQGQPTVIQAVEGAHFLEGHIERVAIAYGRGLRHMGLLHDSDASTPLGDVYTNPVRYHGLTDFGAQVIRECNRLGMLVDLAHANLQTTAMALKVTKRPAVISHTGPDWRLGNDPQAAAMMRPRLISKEQAKLVADAGGLVGVWTHLADTPLAYAENLRAMADVIGVDHVCIGTDTKLTQPSPHKMGSPPPGFAKPPAGGPPPDAPHIGERTNQAWAGETTGFYFTVVNAMLRAGFTPEEIGKIGGGNYLRVFGEAVS